MSFRPNQICWVFQQTETNAYGEPVFADGYIHEIGIVKLIAGAKKTTVRADSSASRGAAEETLAMSKILFSKKKDPLVGSKVQYRDMLMRINAVHPRYSVYGQLDHYECDLELWTDED